ISSWMTSVWSLFAVVNALQSSIRTITEMQVAMIDLRKVMDESTTNFNEMRDAAIELGQAMGRLPTEVARVMYEFAKQGKEQAEVIELTKTALMAMNVAELDAEQAVKYLTSATLQLNMAASESSVILDAWN